MDAPPQRVVSVVDPRQVLDERLLQPPGGGELAVELIPDLAPRTAYVEP